MTRLSSKFLGATALAFSLLVAAPAMAAEAFGDWDANKDSMIDENEFATGFAENGVYDEWDANDDNTLSEDEFNAGVFGGYDADDNDSLSESEFNNYSDDAGDGGLWDI